MAGWEAEKRPEFLECLKGDDLGGTVQEARCGGGEVPQCPEFLLLPLDVRRRCGSGGVPIENWRLGGDMETTSRAGEHDVPGTS